MSSISNEKVKEYTRRILLARYRILQKNGFFGLLLLNIGFGLDAGCETAYTNGSKISFSPAFLDAISDKELEFVMMHEIMHIVLKHCFRGRSRDIDENLFNIACDIVVNSNILYANNMDLSSITVKGFNCVSKLTPDGASMHLAPNKKEGYLYTAEEVYNMFSIKKIANDSPQTIDDHSHWEFTISEGNNIADEWEKRIIDAGETIANRGAYDQIPLGIQRVLKDLKNATLNWRLLLNDFISYEVADYSFNPPDKRMDGPFLLPDFNDLDECIDKKLLFVVDTSGSMTDDMIRDCFSEVKAALEVSNHIDGYVVCNDATYYKPTKVDDVSDILKLAIQGGGGSDFTKIFEQLDKVASSIDGLPDMIIILTDGDAEYPPKSMARDIPVLWIINNTKFTPPWGIVARISE